MIPLYEPGQRVVVLGAHLDIEDHGRPITGTIVDFVAPDPDGPEEDNDFGEHYLVELDPEFRSCTEDDGVWEIEEVYLDPWEEDAGDVETEG